MGRQVVGTSPLEIHARPLSPTHGAQSGLERARADLAIYLAGADPYRDDRLGRLKLTKQGLAERDRLVLGRCRAAGLPVAVTMAGGYARRVEDTADIHFETVRLAAELSRGPRVDKARPR